MLNLLRTLMLTKGLNLERQDEDDAQAYWISRGIKGRLSSSGRRSTTT